VLIEKKQS